MSLSDLVGMPQRKEKWGRMEENGDGMTDHSVKAFQPDNADKGKLSG